MVLAWSLALIAASLNLRSHSATDLKLEYYNEDLNDRLEWYSDGQKHYVSLGWYLSHDLAWQTVNFSGNFLFFVFLKVGGI